MPTEFPPRETQLGDGINSRGGNTRAGETGSSQFALKIQIRGEWQTCAEFSSLAEAERVGKLALQRCEAPTVIVRSGDRFVLILRGLDGRPAAPEQTWQHPLRLQARSQHSNNETSSSLGIEDYALVGCLVPGTGLTTTTVHRNPFCVGRNRQNALVLPDPTVSAHHAEIRMMTTGPVVIDLNSTNGTLLDGRRVEGTQPIRNGTLLQFGSTVFLVSTDKNDLSNHTESCGASSGAVADHVLRQLLETRGLIPHYQPIVELTSGATVGFESFARSRYPGLQLARDLFQVAERNNLEIDLSHESRLAGIEHSRCAPGRSTIFLNTHPREIGTPEFRQSLDSLRSQYPYQAMCLEVHQASQVDVTMLLELKDVLSHLNIQLAFDDISTGQARFLELIAVRPDYLKFDMRIWAGAPDHRRADLATIFTGMIRDLGIIPLAKNLETVRQQEFCQETGFLLGQGYYYGHPKPFKS